MTQLKLFKTIILWGLIIGIFFSGCSVWFFQKNDHLQSKLPKERILANDIQNRIEHTITEALRNVLNRSDFELAVHVNLYQDEFTEELITYEPQKVATKQSKSQLVPTPKITQLPGLMNSPFHHESLPGFPSYFNQLNIQKNDYVTRGLFAKIVSTAYQLPASSAWPTAEIMDTNESEFTSEINDVVRSDILKLYETGEFKPNDFLSKAALITALVRINYPTENNDSTSVFSELPYQDIPTTHWAYTAIKTALENRLIAPDTLFNPNQKVTVQDTLDVIQKTPLRNDVFNYYSFLPPNNEPDLDLTKKETITDDTVYYNQEIISAKTPSTKIKHIDIRVLVNELALTSDITMPAIESIIKSVIELNSERNDSLQVSRHKFIKPTLLMRIYAWDWNTIGRGLLVIIITYFLFKGIQRYQNYRSKKYKTIELKKKKEATLTKIIEDNERQSLDQMKKRILTHAMKHPDAFSLKLERWIELLQLKPQFEDTPDGVYEKVAIILLFVDFEQPGLSGKIIKQFGQKYTKHIMVGIESIRKIDTTKTRMTLIEFFNDCMSSDTLFGGTTTSKHIINQSFNPKEQHYLFNMDQNLPFKFLQHLPTNELNDLIISENPATAAFIMNQLPHDLLIQITAKIPVNQLTPIANHLLHVKNTTNQTMDKFEETLNESFQMGPVSDDASQKIQIRKASSVFETLPKDVRSELLSNVAAQDPAMLKKITNEMFLFEDIVYLSDADTQQLIFELKDMSLIATALHTAKESLKTHIITNCSDRFKEQYNIATESETDVTPQKINDAQLKIIQTLRDLEKNHRIDNLKETKRSRL
jgi:flagellar motor switch protein FliG